MKRGEYSMHNTYIPRILQISVKSFKGFGIVPESIETVVTSCDPSHFFEDQKS